MLRNHIEVLLVEKKLGGTRGAVWLVNYLLFPQSLTPALHQVDVSVLLERIRQLESGDISGIIQAPGPASGRPPSLTNRRRRHSSLLMASGSHATNESNATSMTRPTFSSAMTSTMSDVHSALEAAIRAVDQALSTGRKVRER